VKKPYLIAAIVVALIALPPLVRFVGVAIKGQEAEFKFAEISRGEIKKTVSSSGPLSPITKVEVGSQVSGFVSKVYVDYNDKVAKDQVLAEIDKALVDAEVARAEGELLRAQAELEDAQIEYNRNIPLFEKKTIAEAQFLTSKVKVKSMEGGLKIAEANLDHAKKNLEYATIRSPIDGTVVVKNVEEGQTLAANFQTPRLFEIAENIAHMEILVAVDESDIGMIQPGQKTKFEVQSYSGKTFTGSVKKVRLQPVRTANVVNYTVVVSIENKDSLLLPGMTAEVDFIVADKPNVIKVPKTALNFQPDKEQLDKLRGKMTDDAIEKNAKSADLEEDTGLLWYLDDHGKIAIEQVKTGISDGGETELTNPGRFREGMKVISGLVEKDETKKTDKSGNKTLMGGPPGPGPGGGGGPPG
jgi:HlyD family secretion protein